MTVDSVGFHEGELAVQRRAGVRAEADRLSSMLATPDLNGGARRFLGERDLAVLTARDGDGTLWTSALHGRPGFLDGRDSLLRLHDAPGRQDPLFDMPAGQPVGMLAIDFAKRRRMRINGTLTTVDHNGLLVTIDQAYGNCPRYIHPHRFDQVDDGGPTEAAANAGWPSRSHGLDAAQTRLIEQADTLFLGTIHPTRGADTSHRGGPAGFVHVEGAELSWPDFPGNNMFNSFGNLAIDDSAALLFVDFASGTQLHLSGTAAVEWAPPGAADDDFGTGRRVRFRIRHVTSG